MEIKGVEKVTGKEGLPVCLGLVLVFGQPATFKVNLQEDHTSI